jgi:hypothetical protein
MLFLLTILFVVTQFVLFIFFTKAIREFKKSHNPDEEVLKKAKQQTVDIIQSAIQKSNVMLADAEKKGIDILAHEESLGQGLSEEYAQHLKAVEESFKAQFEKSGEDAQKAYLEFVAQVGHVVNDKIDQNDKLLQEKAEEMLKVASESLEKITLNTQEMVKKEVDSQLESAKSEINEYKLRRMKMIDERIIQMLEDVIAVTLEKKLSLVEQSELVYRALEEAKKENAFK